MWRKLEPEDIYKLRENNIIISNVLFRYEEAGLTWEQALLQAIIRLDTALHHAIDDKTNATSIDELNSIANLGDFHID